jgi:hypothetical protein
MKKSSSVPIPELERLEAVRWEIEQLERLMEAARDRRDRIIFDLSLRDNVSMRDIAIAADLSEGRVYQVVRSGPLSISGNVDGQPARMVKLDDDGQEWLAFVLHEDEDGYHVTEEEL